MPIVSPISKKLELGTSTVWLLGCLFQVDLGVAGLLPWMLPEEVSREKLEQLCGLFWLRLRSLTGLLLLCFCSLKAVQVSREGACAVLSESVTEQVGGGSR